MLIGLGACLSCTCLMAIYYQYKLKTYQEAPFAVPAFCPDCLFPQMDVEINEGKNIDNFLSDSEDSLSQDIPGNTRGNPANTRGGPTTRETKYKPPNFLFND